MGTTVCAEQLQKFHSSHKKLNHLRNIDVPARKLLSRRAAAAAKTTSFNDDSSSSPQASEQSLFRKFLSYNSGFDDDDDDPYSSDHFRMFVFKIRWCTRRRSHDWTDCPLAHPGEKARRRDPRRFAYSSAVCPEFRRGGCSKGESCELAHGVFECWLHPASYRIEACEDGKSCKRKVCFFAHSPRQLSVLPSNGSAEDSPTKWKAGNRKTDSSGCNHCCVFCWHHPNSNNNNGDPNSPTSTLLNFSPQHSPIKNRSSVEPSLSSFSRFSGCNNNGSLSYEEALPLSSKILKRKKKKSKIMYLSNILFKGYQLSSHIRFFQYYIYIYIIFLKSN